MFRLLILPAAAVAICALGAGELFAQDGSTWPSVPLDGQNWRGPGFYLSWVKIVTCWSLFLAWVGTTDWVSRDCQILELDYLRWNPIVFGSFMGAFVLLWLIPYFWVGFFLLLIAYATPLIWYILYRNSKVQMDERVLTRDHLRYCLATMLNKLGMKMEVETKEAHEKGPPVTLLARGGETERDDNARTLAARQSLGFRDARQLLADALSRRASAIMLDYSQQGVGIRVMVDGVWLNDEPQSRETADPMLEALKLVCGLNPQERQNRQEGAFVAEYESIGYEGTLACQGTKTGERAIVQFEDKKTRFEKLDELGMREKMQEQVLATFAMEKGFVLISAMPANGLRSTMNVLLHNTDRFTREFVTIEDEANPYEEVENIPATTYKAADGQSPTDVLPKLLRMDPNVILIRDLPDAATVSVLAGEVEENRLIISTMRAKDCAEALVRVLAIKVPPAEFAPAAAAVLNQRLIRKLCEHCKEAYAPTPQVLQQLGIPQGRVQAFYRPPQQPEEVCPECGGVGYIGRTAIFELLIVDDTVRKVLAASPKLDLVRQACRKAGMRTLQEEGILLVAKGVTSLPELMRIMKQ